MVPDPLSMATVMREGNAKVVIKKSCSSFLLNCRGRDMEEEYYILDFRSLLPPLFKYDNSAFGTFLVQRRAMQ